MITRDLFGQLLLPENLGYVPLEAQSAEPFLTCGAVPGALCDATPPRRARKVLRASPAVDPHGEGRRDDSSPAERCP